MIELLAPAGNLEKLKFAFSYGADAVYLGGKDLSLRAGSANFTLAEIEKGVKIAGDLGKKVYVALNIFAHNRDLEKASSFIRRLDEIGVDAFIASDPGIISLIKGEAPGSKIHLSTQANTTNYRSVNFWKDLGVSRIVLARELTLKEIQEIRKNSSVELEIFVHGAMCMSYSGRCLISNFLTKRDANRGDCAHPCRWQYHLVEEKRPGEFFPVLEDDRGSYFFNSKDLNLIRYIPEIIESGINSIKIEGRNKSIYYLATVVRAYRSIVDQYMEEREKFEFNPNFSRELKYVSHRRYSTGFFLDENGEEAQSQDSSSYIRNSDFLGIVREIVDQATNTALIDIRGKFSLGEEINILKKKLASDFFQDISLMLDEDDLPLEFTKPNTRVKIRFENQVEPGDIVRRIRP